MEFFQMRKKIEREFSCLEFIYTILIECST